MRKIQSARIFDAMSTMSKNFGRTVPLTSEKILLIMQVRWIISKLRGDHDYEKITLVDVNPREIFLEQRIVDGERFPRPSI